MVCMIFKGVDMGQAVYTATPSADSLSVTASDAKRDFGKILEEAIKGGVVTITKHDSPKAVLISIERFQQLSNSPALQIKTLEAEFDAMLQRMQTPAQRAGVRAAFAASPKAFGRAALEGARKRKRG